MARRGSAWQGEARRGKANTNASDISWARFKRNCLDQSGETVDFKHLVLSGLRRVVATVKSNPVVSSLSLRLQQALYEDRFAGDCYGCSRGVYSSLEEAIRSAPDTKQVGFDHEHLAKEYVAAVTASLSVRSYDYPVLFWLDKLLSEGIRVLDFGGNAGKHFYAYRKYLQFPRDLEWRILEVPAVARAGEALRATLPPPHPVFCISSDSYLPDIFLASGSVQYVVSLVDVLPGRPRHLLINRLPIYDGPTYVTLQNRGSVFFASYVFNRQELFSSMTALGYKLIDLWDDDVDSCIIPFHPHESVEHYHGIYWRYGE